MIRRSLLLIVLLALAVPVTAGAQLTFTKEFDPEPIGPGSVSMLRFTITNAGAVPVSDLAFVDNLPPGVVLATPVAASSDCGGTLSAPDGGGTISLGGGVLGAGTACNILVNVTSSTPDDHLNVTGDLTSSAGVTDPASATLRVDTGRPGFRKSFSPSSVAVGAVSTLTFTIDNTANDEAANFLSFTDNLPLDVVVAAPANATTDCPGSVAPPTLTAAPGSSVVSLINAAIGAGASCTVDVDVTPTAAGRKENVSESLTSVEPQGATELSGKAAAVLTANLDFLKKLFTDDPVAPGGTVTLEFTLTNFDRANTATQISFTDDLSATLAGLTAIGLPLAGPCGAGSLLTGTTLLSFTGGALLPEASCVFSVTLSVPFQAAPGTYGNTTSQVSFKRGGASLTEAPAVDDLVVAAAPLLDKEFVDDPVEGGGAVTLRFTITNTSPTENALDIAFTDSLDALLPGLTPTLLPGGFCGPGSQMSLVTLPLSEQGISITGGRLAAGDSCVFDVVLTLPAGVPGGSYLNQTSEITATVGGVPLTGAPASDTLVVVEPPLLAKSFIDDPVLPGGEVILEFTLTHKAGAPGDATAIAFSDDLNAALAGLVVTSALPRSDVCGAGSVFGGTPANPSLTGGILAPGRSCSFRVRLAVPAGAPPGRHTNTTSAVTATVAGRAATGNPATDDLEVAGLTLTKSFTDDPALAGSTVNLELGLQNDSPVTSAISIGFTDDLDAVLPGLAAIGLPANNVCGAGSQIAGTGLLTFTGGSLAPGAGCTFSVTLAVPAAAAAGVYRNTTSPVSADFGGSAVMVDGASDDLEVTVPLSLTKTFFDDPVTPGDPVTLEFSLGNDDPASNATQLAFTDDLDAALSGLVASGLPTSPCGGVITGTGLLSFSGGSVGAASSCDFTVTLDVPASAVADATNVTSELTGLVGGVATSGAPATDVLEVAVCLAANGENLTLRDDTVTDSRSYEVCETLEVGPNYQVLGPNGELTLRAGKRVIFRNGAGVGVDGSLRAGNDPGL